MAAPVRAGVPLEQGLLELSRDLPGRAGRIAEVLGRRMSAGESLPQILARESDQFPPIWRAVVEAGLRSGELSAALESMSTTARRMAEMRKLIGAALIYPLMVLALAYAVFVFQVTRLIPVMSRVRRFDGRHGCTFDCLDLDRRHGDLVGQPDADRDRPACGAWWYRSSRVIWSRRQRAGTRWSRGWLRGASVRQTLCDGRMAAFAEVLSLLVKQRVPLQEAIVLAADASGDGSIRHASREIADRLQRGEVIVRRENLPAPFPPLLGWMLVTGGRQPELGEALRRHRRGLPGASRTQRSMGRHLLTDRAHGDSGRNRHAHPGSGDVPAVFETVVRPRTTGPLVLWLFFITPLVTKRVVTSTTGSRHPPPRRHAANWKRAACWSGRSGRGHIPRRSTTPGSPFNGGCAAIGRECGSAQRRQSTLGGRVAGCGRRK